jgi:F-type H+-transporting ATPase subunit epsilon
MDENFNIEIISPEKKLFAEKGKSVIIPSFEGEMTILPDHISIITFLRPGVININENKKKYFVEEGTVEFSKNNLTILSSTIIDLDSLSKDVISSMLEDSKKELNQENLDDKKRYIISHKIDCLSQINL